ncbi:MAG: plasmid mobilization relaxosome protein MobC [Truepera sp.]|nr:plasmid mobilization relaxosome protein MobC [Truepera sp.]
MARTRTWTAPAAEVERTRQIARIGNNLNQIARWANTHKAAVEAVEVVAHLVAIERAVAALTSVQAVRLEIRAILHRLRNQTTIGARMKILE